MVVNPVRSLEMEVQSFLDVDNAIGVCNGTAALHTSLLACGIQKGDQVITTPFTFPATANAILMCGATPVFVDISPQTLCLDEKLVRGTLKGEDISGVLTVDLFGRFSDMEELEALCLDHGIPLVEDASQAFGAKYENRFAGTWGDAGTFSFYASKNLWSFEGGMIVTDNDVIAHKAYLIRNHGLDDYGEMIMMGYNYKMPWICAFIADTNLRLHKPGIVAELGRYGLEDGYYPRVVYEHKHYRQLGITGYCPVAEKIAKYVRTR